MPSNQQRREAAKRKLERQLARRQERARSRRQRLTVIGAVAAVVIAAGVVWLVTSKGSGSNTANGDTSGASSTNEAPKTPCSYTTEGAVKATKQVKPPANLSPANTGTVDVTITLNGKPVTATLDRKTSPCGVNAFVSLASQGFYNNTDCYRLTASAELNVLQCGDPSNKGNGGPGFTYAIESSTTAKYPAGTIALANDGQANGSQFFITYDDAKSLSGYTVLGAISAVGLQEVKDIAAKGVKDNRQDGAPIAPAAISSITVPDNAVEATGVYPTATPSSTNVVDTNAPSAGESGQPSTGAQSSPSAGNTATSTN